MLLPLMYYKNNLPSYIFASVLVLIHVFVLIVYFWNVAFRKLDPDWRSLVARIIGLLFFVYLLIVVDNWS